METSKIVAVLKSARVWAAIIGIASVITNEFTGQPLDEATMNQIVILVLGLIGARTVTDVAAINKRY